MLAKSIESQLNNFHESAKKLTALNNDALRAEEFSEKWKSDSIKSLNIETYSHGTIYISLSVDKLTDATEFVRAAVREYGKPLPRIGNEGPRTEWRWKVGKTTVAITVSLTGNVCKRVQVGVKTVTREEPVYEIQCPPEEVDIDIDSEQIPF